MNWLLTYKESTGRLELSRLRFLKDDLDLQKWKELEYPFANVLSRFETNGHDVSEIDCDLPSEIPTDAVTDELYAFDLSDTFEHTKLYTDIVTEL